MPRSERATAEETVAAWLAALAATGPNPGGGAAAALMAGMAAALTEMVIAYRIDRESDERSVRARANKALAEALRAAAPSMADRDTEVSEGFSAASRGDSDSTTREEAGVAAAESSAALGKFAASLVPVLRELAEQAGTLLLADVGVAASALAASVRAAALNICADLEWAGAGDGHSRIREDLAELDAMAVELDAIAADVRTRLVGSRS